MGRLWWTWASLEDNRVSLTGPHSRNVISSVVFGHGIGTTCHSLLQTGLNSL